MVSSFKTHQTVPLLLLLSLTLISTLKTKEISPLENLLHDMIDRSRGFLEGYT